MIPFATVEATEAALGRSLTFAEAAWFRYSASTPDYCLCFHNFVILFASSSARRRN
jgi:4,4-dimethyl-9beta,19-cyclopropylsterol-4alpha-methyl oxidase